MAQTTWHAKARPGAPRKFLLTDGTIVDEPDLEITTTGRKVRLAGTSVSAYSRDEYDLIVKGLGMTAQQHKAQVWMPVDPNETALRTTTGFDRDDTRAVFTVEEKRLRATAWWTFKHPTLPIKALVAVKWLNPNGYVSGNTIQTTVVIPDQTATGLTPLATKVVDRSFTRARNELDEPARASFSGWITENPAEWASLLGSKGDLTERDAVEALLRQVRAVDALSEIQIPDFRKAGRKRFGWLTLEADGSNVTNRFTDDMLEYLDNTGTETIAAAYIALRDEFRRVGVVMDSSLKHNQLYQALVDGDERALTVKIGGDVDHVVSIHLASGTFVVDCDLGDRDEIAKAWEESHTIATLTGRKDHLLAYADAFVQQKHDKRTTQIMARRATN
jgi:hypothetical protein